MSTTYSHSRLNTFSNCPRKYQFQYVDRVKVPRRESPFSHLGSAVHSVLQKLYQTGADGIVIPFDGALKFYDSEWQKVDLSRLVVHSQFHTVDDYMRMGREMLKTHYDRYQPFRHGKLLGTELHLNFSLPEYGFRFTAIIDRLWKTDDGIVEICDYKTGQSLSRPSDPAFISQMGIYLLAVQQSYPQFEQIDQAMYFLRHDEIVRHRMSGEERDLLIENLRNNVIAIKEAERLSNFPTKESGLCPFCDWFDFCPAKRHAKQLEEESDDHSDAESLRDLADSFLVRNDELKALKAEVDTLKTELKEAASTYGFDRITGSKGDVTVKLSMVEKFITKTKDADAYASLNFLVRELGLDDFMTVDANALMKEIYSKRRLPDEQMEKLREFVIATQSGRISGKLRAEKEGE